MRPLAVCLALLVAGCTATPPPTPGDGDFAVIIDQRIDSVWLQSKLDESARPQVTVGEPARQFEAARLFAACMVEQGWSDYYVNENGTGYGYRAIQLTTSDAETLDWFECFAAHPVDSEFTFESTAQFDLVYDYYQDSLIPCLAENGYPVSRAPTRIEFRTTLVGFTDPLFPFIWNPYYDIDATVPVEQLPVAAICPPEPPEQDFYEYR